MNKQFIWHPDLGDGTYKNPIIHADYSDPDAIRVGSDYFMVASSFNMSPSLPVLHSTDLIHWKIINHVAAGMPNKSYEKPRHGDGVWAPSIRYHDGYFWVFFGAPDESIFMSKTKDPFGEWSPLHLVKKVKGWIDPCPFWEDERRAYLIHAFARSRIGFKSLLQLCRMKSDGTALLDEGKIVFDGNINHPTIKGPKLYKRKGYYYIFAPAGGVATGWQTILKSKSIAGPYEDKIVLHQGKTEINGPHQGAWVETEDNESWFIHFQDKGPYGRVTHLQPMEWKEDWPVMGTGEGEISEPVLRWKKPKVKENGEVVVPQTNDDFTGEELGLQWQWRANEQKEWYSFSEGNLVLHARYTPATRLYDVGQILTQKFPAPSFVVETEVSLQAEDPETIAGLFFGGFSYGGIQLRRHPKGLALYKYIGTHKDGKTRENTEFIDLIPTKQITLRIYVEDGGICQLSYQVKEESEVYVGEKFAISKGQWIGAIMGIFCLNRIQRHSKDVASFSHFFIKKHTRPS